MSTRGCVAIGTEREWRGFYNHYDSYPTGLGCKVWEALKRFRSIDEFENDDIITSDYPDPLFIEWVYIYNPEKDSLIILTSVGRRFWNPVKENVEKLKNNYWDYGHCIYKHFKVAEFSLNGEEPDWKDLETNAMRYIKERLWEELSKVKSDKSEILAKLLKFSKEEKEPEEEIIMIDEFLNELKVKG